MDVLVPRTQEQIVKILLTMGRTWLPKRLYSRCPSGRDALAFFLRRERWRRRRGRKRSSRRTRKRKKVESSRSTQPTVSLDRPLRQLQLADCHVSCQQSLCSTRNAPHCFASETKCGKKEDKATPSYPCAMRQEETMKMIGNLIVDEVGLVLRIAALTRQ